MYEWCDSFPVLAGAGGCVLALFVAASGAAFAVVPTPSSQSAQIATLTKQVSVPAASPRGCLSGRQHGDAPDQRPERPDGQRHGGDGNDQRTGNLIIGYNESPGTQTGSRNLVIGQGQSFTSYGGSSPGVTTRSAVRSLRSPAASSISPAGGLQASPAGVTILPGRHVAVPQLRRCRPSDGRRRDRQQGLGISHIDLGRHLKRGHRWWRRGEWRLFEHRLRRPGVGLAATARSPLAVRPPSQAGQPNLASDSFANVAVG